MPMKELYDVEQRWLLGAGEAFETTVTPETSPTFRRQESHLS